MKYTLLIIILFTVLLSGCSDNEENIENETVVREDKFIKEEVNTQDNEESTLGSGESNIRDNEKPLLDILENATNSDKQPELIRNNIWNCDNFKDIQFTSDYATMIEEEITNINILTLLKEIEEEEKLFIYAIETICKDNNINIDSVRVLEDIIKYSEDYSYFGVSLQSDDKYINIAYSYDNNRLCYEMKNKK